MTAGVYRIRNRITGEVYIGSTINITQRIKAHVSAMRSGRHENSRLRAAWQQHGLDGFAFSILEVTDRTDAALEAAEARWLQRMRGMTVLYNRRDANVGRHYGKHQRAAEQRYRERRPLPRVASEVTDG